MSGDVMQPKSSGAEMMRAETLHVEAIAGLDRFADISLTELVEQAALLTRVDRKYIVDRQLVERVLDDLEPETRVLSIEGQRGSRYESTYFDTPDLASFHGAALKRRRRFKVRTRSYLDSGEQYLEVKTSGSRGVTVKERIDLRRGALQPLGDDGLGYIADTLCATGVDGIDPQRLRPVLKTSYLRTTLYVPSSESRATIDTDLTWRLCGEGDESRLRTLRLSDTVIVETKSGASPSAVDRALWRHGLRPRAISKYATGMAAFDPALPRNRWARVIRQHFDAARMPGSGPSSPGSSSPGSTADWLSRAQPSRTNPSRTDLRELRGSRRATPQEIEQFHSLTSTGMAS